jgi:hypothetical protein
MNNYEFFKGMVDSADLNKIFGIAAEEVFEAIPEDVMSKGMKATIKKATVVIIPVLTGIYKNAFLSVYREEFSDEEFGRLFTYYGPGSALWEFFNTPSFFPWLQQTIKERIQARIAGLDLASMSTGELQSLAQIGLNELIDQLPEEVKASSADYTGSDLYYREASLGEKIATRGIEAMTKIDWCDLLEKSGITPPEDIEMDIRKAITDMINPNITMRTNLFFFLAISEPS